MAPARTPGSSLRPPSPSKPSPKTFCQEPSVLSPNMYLLNIPTSLPSALPPFSPPAVIPSLWTAVTACSLVFPAPPPVHSSYRNHHYLSEKQISSPACNSAVALLCAQKKKYILLHGPTWLTSGLPPTFLSSCAPASQDFVLFLGLPCSFPSSHHAVISS